MPAIVWPRPSRSATSPLRSSKNSRRLSESLGKRSAATAIASATWLCALRNSGSFAFWTSDCRRNRSARSARGSACSLVSRARSEEHTSELQSLMRISYAVFCLKKKKQLKSPTIHDDYVIEKHHKNQHPSRSHRPT